MTPAPRLRRSLAAVLVLACACRAVPPPSGTPLGAGESLALGVVRESNGYGLRHTELLAAAEEVAGGVEQLLPAEARGARILLVEPTNESAVPEPGFRGMRAQLRAALSDALRRRGYEPLSEPAGATHSLVTSVAGLAREDRFFTLDWLLVEGAVTGSKWRMRRR